MEKTLQFLFRSKGREINMGSYTPFGIITYEGISSSDTLLNLSPNAMQDGSSCTSAFLADRVISLSAELESDQDQELYRELLIHFFDPKSEGNLTVNYCGVKRNIDYRVQKFNILTPQTLWDSLTLTVDLICPKPYFNDMDSFGKNIAAITPQFTFPLAIQNIKGKIMGYKTFRQEVLIHNAGDTDTGIEVIFTAKRGTVTNPKLIKVSTGEVIRIITVMQQGDVLKINTNERSKRIELNGVNIFNKLDRASVFFNIDVGDNVLKYDADVNYVNLEVRPYYTPKYLGV